MFHNEGWSVLLRTVHSVMNRSPGDLLQEILLVDDFSDKADLGEKLETYIKRFRGKVSGVEQLQPSAPNCDTNEVKKGLSIE